MDIKLFRQHLAKQQGLLEATESQHLIESSVVFIDHIHADRRTTVTSLQSLLRFTQVKELSAHQTLTPSEIENAIKSGKTLYVYIDPYEADVGNNETLRVALSRTVAQKEMDDSAGDI